MRSTSSASNYGLDIPDEYHKKNPTRPIYGSETSSALSTRGVYATDPLRNTVNAYDSVVRWAKRPRSGGSSTRRASGRRADLPGPASIIAVSRRLTDGRRSTRSSASWICAVFQGYVLLLQGLVAH